MSLDNETIKMMLEIIMNEKINKNQIEPKFISDTKSKLIFNEPPKKNNKKEVQELPKLVFTEPPKKNNKKEVEKLPKLVFTEPPKIKNEIEPKIIIKNEIEPKRF